MIRAALGAGFATVRRGVADNTQKDTSRFQGFDVKEAPLSGFLLPGESSPRADFVSVNALPPHGFVLAGVVIEWILDKHIDR